ncbi:MAG: glycosyltransferase family 4 protein [Candidatus Eremiobacteraeota bacterium]|nr:glycosyltransferase family 4 protein [Candidatus Eremiobacteraeota bacterium]
MTYYFPPQPDAGALRPGYLAKYLPQFGWEPSVVTRKHPLASGSGCRIERAGVLGVPPPALGGTEHTPARPRPKTNALRTLAKKVIFFPDAAIGWLPGALKISHGLQKEQRFDAVISTALPATAHLVGSAVSRRYSIPWIADYRDLWTGYPYGNRGWVRRALDRQVERATVRGASLITTVSEDLAEKLQRIHRRVPVEVIPNGFEAASEGDPDAVIPQFRFCYAGMLYGGERNPEALFAAIAKLRATDEPAGHAARFIFFGPDRHFVQELAARYGLDDVVDARGIVSHEAVVREERASAVLLILLKDDPATAAETGSKIFEYIATRRPILAFGQRESVLRSLITKNSLGWFASDVDECASAIKSAYQQHVAGIYERVTTSTWTLLTAREVSARFASMLDRVVG